MKGPLAAGAGGGDPHGSGEQVAQLYGHGVYRGPSPRVRGAFGPYNDGTAPESHLVDDAHLSLRAGAVAADTVVLGMGHATLTSVGGAVPLEVKDAAGIVIAGVTIDAGEELSPMLMKVGNAQGAKSLDPANPITLSDVYFRVGGPHIGKTSLALNIAEHAAVVTSTR